jgi:hypothetical protein
VSKGKQPTKAQLLYAAQAIFEARVIVERYLQQPDGRLDDKLRELELNYYRHAETPANDHQNLTI